MLYSWFLFSMGPYYPFVASVAMHYLIWLHKNSVSYELLFPRSIYTHISFGLRVAYLNNLHTSHSQLFFTHAKNIQQVFFTNATCLRAQVQQHTCTMNDIIGENMSESHTSELNGRNFWYMYIFIVCTSITCMYIRAAWTCTLRFSSCMLYRGVKYSSI